MKKKNVVVFTGAGISAESGVPTFRDKIEGIWTDVNPLEVATIEKWEEDPETVSKFHEELRQFLKDKKPNDAHKYVADLEKDYNVTVITQNVDNLHELAGSSEVLHLHGHIDKAQCEITRKVYEVDGDRVMFGNNSVDDGRYKPYTVLFGEMPHDIENCVNALNHADIFIVIGTGFDISYILPMLGANLPESVEGFYIDPDPSPGLQQFIKNLTIVKEKASEGVKKLIFQNNC
jgi:NAD-dependent deacetylase